MSGINPTSITAERGNNLLKVVWADEHISTYPFELLRAACPCAGCRGGHEYMSEMPDPHVFDIHLGNNPMTLIKKLEGVGTYAINIAWEDGHHYGIYNWHYLRALCPCPVCQRGRNHA